MSTRESMRRELRELAKLAETKRQEQTKTPRSSGEWSYVDPAAEAATAAESPVEEKGAVGLEPADAVDPPSWPSSATVPPVVPSAGTPSIPSELERLAASAPAPRRGSRWLIAGFAAVVLVGAAVVGQRLQHGTAAPTAMAATPPPPPAVPQEPLPPPAAEPANAAVAPAAAPPPAAAAPAPVVANGPSTHRTAPAPRPAKTPRSPSPSAATKPAPAGAAANHVDSLDDLMRKAVSSPSK